MSNEPPSRISRAAVDIPIGVVVVTYHPVGNLDARLAQMSAQGRALVVVDNASGPEVRRHLEETCDRQGWELVANPENLGVGAAMNQGLTRLAKRGFEWALFFDQDSEPLEGMGERMLEAMQRHPQSGRVAVVGAVFEERSTGRRHRFLRRYPGFPFVFQKVEAIENDLTEVSFVISSGSLVRVATAEIVGGFDESFFIDYVDTDFCLRCRRAGWFIMVSAAARFRHALGQRDRRVWCGIEIQPTHHSALRHYFIARNRITMWRRHAVAVPHWALFDFCFGMYNGFRVLAFESDRWRKFKAMVLGTWDGLCGRKGPCPERRASVLADSGK